MTDQTETTKIEYYDGRKLIELDVDLSKIGLRQSVLEYSLSPERLKVVLERSEALLYGVLFTNADTLQPEEVTPLASIGAILPVVSTPGAFSILLPEVLLTCNGPPETVLERLTLPTLFIVKRGEYSTHSVFPANGHWRDAILLAQAIGAARHKNVFASLNFLRCLPRRAASLPRS